MKIAKELSFLFKETGAKRWLNRPRLPRGAAMFPKTTSDKPLDTREYFLYSDDPEYLRWTEHLADALPKEFPSEVLPNGFAGPSAVPTDFNNVLNVTGHGANPMPLPLMDNAEFRKSLGLADRLREADKPWLVEIIKLFFGHAVPAPLYIRKAASTSFMYFTTDNQYKKVTTYRALANIDDYLQCFNSGPKGLLRALNEYDSILVYALHERQSPNRIKCENGVYSSVKRAAPTEEEARTGKVSDKSFCDMSVKDSFGNTIKDHFAMRRRAVWGMNGILNYVMTAIMGCHRAVYLERFAFTYKTRGSEDKEQKIAPYEYVVGSDVKAMDTTFPDWFFEFLLEELYKYWAPPLVETLRQMLHATAVCPPPWKDTPDSYNPIFGPSPLSGEADIKMGLPSGVFINPDLGKLFMTFVYVLVFRDAGALVTPGDIEPFLQGKNPQHALQDMSDDAAMLTNSASVAEKLKVATSPYVVLEPETPVVFLGDVYAVSNGRRRAFPNPVTYVVNVVARESSIARINPVTYAEGVLARQQRYAATPVYRDLSRFIELSLREHCGVNPFSIARTMAKRQKFTELDALVRENPHYLHYRVDPADVSKELLDELVATIPATDFFNSIRHLFNFPTTQL